MARRHFLVQRRPDANQAEIVAALRKAGVHVWDLSAVGGGVPDLAITRGNSVVLFLEVKTAKGKVREKQSEAAKHWPIVVVRTVEGALGAIGLEG